MVAWTSHKTSEIKAPLTNADNTCKCREYTHQRDSIDKEITDTTGYIWVFQPAELHDTCKQPQCNKSIQNTERYFYLEDFYDKWC